MKHTKKGIVTWGVLLLGLGLGLAPAAPAAPAQFVLTWTHQQDASTPATGFAVQRCVQSGSTCAMADLAGATALAYDTPTYSDGAIVPGQTYCYQVAAVNQWGRSPYSSQFCAQLGGPPKNAPAGLSIRIVPATP